MSGNQRLYIILAVLTSLAFATNFASFVSPYWIQSLPSANSQFQRIGLWTACFNGYMRPGMYNKAYFGCYYIYFVEYDAIRNWINPIWLYGIQVSSSCGILIQFLVFFFVMCQATQSISRTNMSVLKFSLTGHFFTCITLSAALVAFAVARYDSRWMPYPGLNILSWSYIVAAFSFALSLSAFLVAFVYYISLDAQMDAAEQKPLMMNDDADDGDPNHGLHSAAITHDDLEALPDEPMGKQSYLGSSLVRPDEWNERESEFRTDTHPPSYLQHASSIIHDSRR